jgi:hypothetical protein
VASIERSGETQNVSLYQKNSFLDGKGRGCLLVATLLLLRECPDGALVDSNPSPNNFCMSEKIGESERYATRGKKDGTTLSPLTCSGNE